MALEHFKTQVLLLHHEQRTLDDLGARFGERYAVHFATTGSEALSTLGSTPIHIIVSSHKLPGMSGLEALREAKKRSPDTIGILLTGEHGKEDIEALVGEQEVFQIVRGAVQPDMLLQIVESAARRVRMMTISESANDNEAAKPAPVSPAPIRSANDSSASGEHIIMETMENGASMITDASGRMPVLDPNVASVAGNSRERSVDVLVLSKDQEFISTIRACVRGLHNVHHAMTAQQAQNIVANHKVGVLVTDAAIAGNKVALLTKKLRMHAPRLVAIVAGRRDDGESLMELINQGQVYRFLLKPVSPGRARLAVEACVKYHLDAPDSTFAAREAAQFVPEPAAPPAPPQEPAPQRPAPAAKAARIPESTVDPLARTDSFRVLTSKPPGLENDSLGEQVRLPLLPATVAALLLAAVAGWYFFVNPAANESVTVVERPAPAAVAPAAAPAEAPAAAASNKDAYLGLLDNARFARDSGRLLTPPGDNALEWYVEARSAAPDNLIIRDELAALVDQLLGMAESAMLENRIADVDLALSMVAQADPDNARLAFLSTQRNQQLLQTTLDEARAAIRAGRFEDASRLLADAQQLPGANQDILAALRSDLSAARSAQRLDDVLALANARLSSGQLTAPANDNARYYFELAANNAPGNTAAQQGLLTVASSLVLSARAAIDAGDFDSAGELLEDARALNAASPELQATEKALERSLQIQADALRRAAAARQSATQDNSAKDGAGLRRSAAATATLPNQEKATVNAAAAAPAAATNSGAAASTTAAAAGSDAVRDEIASTGEPAATPPAAAAIVGAANANQNGAPEPATRAQRPLEQVAISQLTRNNYVAPRYPRNARRRNVSGWVDIAFTVQPDGGVGDIEISDSMPGKLFDEAAREAVTQWRFEPVIEDGRAVAKRVAVRLSFALE
ncbi:MAG: TonB family protein [Woeseia sp.]